MNIGLYFGSFNPIHVGHLIIANQLVENSDLDQIWFVVTPHNPFKKKSSLLDNFQRLEMVYLATKDYPKLKESNINVSTVNVDYDNYILPFKLMIIPALVKENELISYGYNDILKHLEKN